VGASRVSDDSVFAASDLDDARRRFRNALAPEDLDRLPFYRALLVTFEADPLMLEILASVREEQRNPMLLLAALHHAALRGHPVLSPLYDRVRQGTERHYDEAASRVLDVLHDEPQLLRDELGRSTQTNEPGRSAVLQAVVAELAKDERRPINLVDVGTSAGINLYFDQFDVRDTDDGSALTLVCEDRTELARPRGGVAVGSRVGVDPFPLDLANEDDQRWLRACLWPEERRRHERLDAIVAAAPRWPRVTILRGTAAERLDEALALGDRDALTVVVNTWVAYYFTPPERTAYYQRLTEECAKGRVAWVSMESPTVRWPRGDQALPRGEYPRGASQVMVTSPLSAPRTWGWCHPHGRWLWRNA